MNYKGWMAGLLNACIGRVWFSQARLTSLTCTHLPFCGVASQLLKAIQRPCRSSKAKWRQRLTRLRLKMHRRMPPSSAVEFRESWVGRASSVRIACRRCPGCGSSPFLRVPGQWRAPRRALNHCPPGRGSESFLRVETAQTHAPRTSHQSPALGLRRSIC